MGYPWEELRGSLQNLFGAYAGPITDLLGYRARYDTVAIAAEDPFPQDRFVGPSHISEDHDYFRSTYSPSARVLRGCDVERNRIALERLCADPSVPASNLLHLVGEIPSSSLESLIDERLGRIRQAAMQELSRRGNPPYDPEAFIQSAE